MTITNIKEVNQADLKHVYNINFNDPNCQASDIADVLKYCENLHYIYISHPTLERLPVNFALLDKLFAIYLDMTNLSEFDSVYMPSDLMELMIRSRTLTDMPIDDIGKFEGLRTLEIDAPITQMPYLKGLNDLNKLSLKATKIEDLNEKKMLPTNITQLTVLENNCLGTVDMSYFPRLIYLTTDNSLQNIHNCKSLEILEFHNINIFPDGLAACILTKRFSLRGGELSELPAYFMQFKNLEFLHLINSKLKTLPADWRQLEKLESLKLYNNCIEDAAFLYTIPKLKEVSITNNPINDKLFMLEGTKALPIYNTEGLFVFKPLNYREIPSFMSALAKSGLNRADKEWFFNVFKDLKTIEITEGWSFHRLVQGLSIPYKIVNDKITTHLQKLELNQKSLDSFKNGAVCYLDGSFTEKKTAIKDKLKLLGITVLTNYTEGVVTHIVLGNKPKDALTFYGENEFAYLLEHQLYQFIKDVGQEDKFLVQEAAAGETSMADGLKQLLASTDANMVQIGLEMLKTGGVTEGVLDELLLLTKTFNDAKVRAETKKILIKQGSAEWIGVINDRQTFVDIQNAKGKEIRDKLEKMAKSVDKSAVFAFAMLIFKYYDKGLAFVLANFATNSDERKAALLALTDRDYFDFFKGVGYYNWKDKRPEEVILSPVKTGIAFPIDHPKAKEIRVINMHNCKFDTLSKDITVFENLEELDLSVNNLKSLPVQIGKLTKLKKLNLSFNRLTTFPAALENLSQLELLDMRHNSASAFTTGLPTAIEIPKNFSEKLPNCVVLL